MLSGPSGYFGYLRGRRLSGLLYRQLWLYPRLCRRLSGRVLDVGCGIGDFLRFRPGTIGVDVDANAVAWCRGLALDAQLMAPDRLPFADEAFNGVVLDNVLEHLASPPALLGEIRRVLRAEGMLIVGVPGSRGFAVDPDHKIPYNEQALIACLRQSGFDCEQIVHMPFPSDFLEVRLRQYCLYGFFRPT